MFENYARLARRSLAGDIPTEEEAFWTLEGKDAELLLLLQAAFVPRRHQNGYPR